MYDLLGDGHGKELPPGGVTFPPNTTLKTNKTSQIGPYLAVQTVKLHPEYGIQVASRLTLKYENTTGKVNFFYPCMTMFALVFKRWVAESLNGTSISGTFLYDNSFTLHSDIRWAAVFDDVSNGALLQFPKPYKGSGSFKNSFWNRKYDHKLYLRIDPPTVVGSTVEIRHSVQGFKAENQSWVETARRLVRPW